MRVVYYIIKETSLMAGVTYGGYSFFNKIKAFFKLNG